MIVIVIFFILVMTFLLRAAYVSEEKDETIIFSVLAGMFMMSIILTLDDTLNKYERNEVKTEFFTEK